MASVRRPASDFISEDAIEDENPSISQLLSPLRDSFQEAEFDRITKAIVAIVAKLKHRNKVQKIDIEKLKIEKSKLELEYDALLSRILQLEDDTKKLVSKIVMGDSITIQGRSESCGVRESDRNDRSVINLGIVLDSLIGPHANGNLQTSVSEAKLKLEIENQRIEYAALEKKLIFELQEKLQVEDELKECKAELQGLKEKPNVANENCEKLLEEVNEGRKDEGEEFVFDSPRKNNELESNSTYAELDSKIERLNKLINSKRVGSRNMEERNKHSGMADDGRKKKSSVSSDHVINVEDLCDSVPTSASSRGSGFHGSGTPKFSPGNAIFISDSDDDCAPGEKKLTVLKRKRASSFTSDNDDGGDNLERDIIPTAEMKQRRKLSRCGSLVNHFSEKVGSFAVSDYGKQINSSSTDQVILRPSEEKIGEKHKSSIKSPAKVSNESGDSSTSISSSDDSEDEDEYRSLFMDVVKNAKA
ncbi:hypothetical protein M0R45_024234 [Rubus argutus]|uniref:Uncharacterized protein n=1 Tax=Rubus argutus TaxID=59490 RepID=A0AAW1WTM3_RUBAR